MAYLNLSKAVCSELAGMVWTDQTQVNVSTAGRSKDDTTPDPLQVFVDDVFKKNDFGRNMLDAVEKAAALGGEALKVWRDVKRDREGNEIEGTERIRIGWSMADQFIPTAWDEAQITDALFISRKAKGGYYYTRLEWHKWNGATYVVTNQLYRAEMQKGTNGAENQDILGVRWPLADVYPYLDEETVIPVGESLFSYFRTPIANNVDDNSPLGISIYGNAMETLHALDVCYDSFVSEFRLGKKRIIVPAQAVDTVVDPQSGRVRRYFNPNNEVYEALSTNSPEELKISDNSVELRVEEHIAAINAFLSILCLQVGFSAGTFTFDQHTGLKTATEVVSENSKTYKTIKTVQNQLRPAIEHMVRNMIDVAALYDVEYEGQSIKALADNGYHVNIVFDDGVTQDRQTNINEGVMLVGAGLLSKKTFMTDPKYGQALTPEQADAELEQIRLEGTGNSVDVTRLFGGME
jgi:A118 family predicted phage portal protein